MKRAGLKPQQSIILLALLMLAACGRDGDSPPAPPPLTAATLGEQTILAAAEHLSMPPYAGADRRQGEKQAQLCKACHSLEAGGPNMVGPALYGFFGRPVGAVEDFDYSAAIRDADFVWTPRALDAWLRQPARFLPGNRMSYPGVAGADERAALIAYLLEVTTE